MTRRIVPLAAAAIMTLALPAYAQGPGMRAGVSADPDQFVFGGHIETKPLLEHLTFRPNVEVGIGNDVTVVALNFEFAYWIPIRNKPWSVYLGAGPAAIFASAGNGSPRYGGDSDVGGGFNIVIGLQHNRGLFTELKVGTIDSPNLKFMVGYVFK
jgi:hypothetical protein